ncbi:MAG: polyprenyl synthetase family protein [Eubacterium sp.]|nr:polyprenyl synthetase family protein [Eubacterium sp.]
MNNFDASFSSEKDAVEEIIYGFCPDEYGKQSLIFEAMNYSVKAGGKRLRPILMLETFKLFGEDESLVYPFMAAIEFIHTYSLVHDDLPAMDDDEFRRGQKTTHAKYGEDIGILAGDGLLNMAYEIMSEAVVSNPSAAKAMAVIAKKAGAYGMVGGQTVDVVNEGKKLDIETVNYIHNLKTAALIEASMMAGAILGGATDEQVLQIESIAKNIGMAFQIQDDILDVTGDEDKLGKPVLSDEKNEKDTYITLIGLEESKQKVKDLSNLAIDGLKALGDNEFLITLVEKLINREY